MFNPFLPSPKSESNMDAQDKQVPEPLSLRPCRAYTVRKELRQRAQSIVIESFH